MVGMDGGWQNTFDVFEDTAAAFARLVSEVPAAAWTMPALGVWSVRDLVGHTSRAFSTVESYLAAPATSVDLGSGVDYLLAALASHPQAIADRGRQAGQALGDDPPAAVADLVGRTLATVRAADPDAAVATPFGGIRVRDYLPTRTFELAVYGLDLAAALGLPPTCPPPPRRPASPSPARWPPVPARPPTCCWRPPGVERCQPDSTFSTYPGPPPEVDLAGLADGRSVRARGRPADAARTRRA
jgi:uncharacterized protein (TIGR03083 family)